MLRSTPSLAWDRPSITPDANPVVAGGIVVHRCRESVSGHRLAVAGIRWSSTPDPTPQRRPTNPIIAVCRSIGGVDRLVREFPRTVSDAAAVIAGCHDALIAFSDAAPSSCQWDTAFPAIVTHFSEVIHRRSARRYPHLNRPAPVPNRQTPNPPRRPRLRVTSVVQREDIDTRPLHIENGFRVVCVKVWGGSATADL